MPTDPASEPPTSETANPAESAERAKPQIEYDDFGLPIRKPRPRTPQVQSDSEDEVFTDAESKVASRENAALPDKGAVGAAGAAKVPEKAVGKNKEEGESGPVAEKGKDEKKSEPVVNGHAEADEGKVEPKKDEEKPPEAKEPAAAHQRTVSADQRNSLAYGHPATAVSEYSHQQLAPQTQHDEKKDDFEDGEWQTMPAYAHYDMYDDDNRLIAKENADELEDMSGYGNLGGAAKGYTRVIMDDDVESQTSMDDNTAYLFKEKGTTLFDEDEAARDPLAQMQTTKSLLTEGQRIAYVGLVRLAMVDMKNNYKGLERTRGTKKIIDMMQETNQMWSQKMMVRLYSHMDINESEQVMIEQLSEHGVVPHDLTPALMQNARVKNPAADESESVKETDPEKASISSPRPDSISEKGKSSTSLDLKDSPRSPSPPPYEEHEGEDLPAVRTPSQLPGTKNLDIDLRWTILCDLFLVLIADSVYDARSRQLLEQMGKYLSVDWLEICRFEKRVTDALEMQEEANKENWNEDEHMETRRKRAMKRRIAFMGLATVGGSLVIGLSAGLLAPVIGAGLAAGFTTIGVAGTSGFLAGAGGAAVITTTGVLSGGTIAVRAAERRTGSVKTFEYRPLHNNKRVHLIVTLAGWMNGKLDDVRLPYSTVDPIMGDIYSVLWEPEMLRSMGDTINILATEALTQGLQQVLGSTILIALMAAIQLPVALTKLSYLIDNPWTVSQARADMAGLILADSLIDRNLGTRPITLVGFSLGARVIFSCLKELAGRGAVGLVQNVYMFGTPVVAKKDEYTKARAIIPGRFVNGYATNDWILGYLFRATSGGIMKVAGLAPVEVPGIENHNVTELVPGHMAYRAAMPKLLREVGWIVESDEFTEIEDPDPENHEQRQRELINEIEEARKELEKKQQEKEKKGAFTFWRKKKATKKDWEVYDEKTLEKSSVGKDDDPAKIAENPVMFDIDALRAEVAALSYSDPIEIKEIKSTLPPMKIDMSQTSPNPYAGLRETKSYNDSLGVASTHHNGGSTGNLSTQSNGSHAPTHGEKKSFEKYDEFDDGGGGMKMTFDSSFKEPRTPAAASSRSHSPLPAYPPSTSPLPFSRSPCPPYERSKEQSWDAQPGWMESSSAATERPPLKSSMTAPVAVAGVAGGAIGLGVGAGVAVEMAPGYNAWADEFEDEFGGGGEMKMTFE
ncbi:DUF726-domain-containing protein [Lentithecium fluviatile CBS 122367]|uniref:DUF726-domain-containing protein n=1 Tax=Lentithecium fluviatile CBS 122367 TaxID=1168545 RepID=A0A6G1IWX0_9PLEO|nr:DUF726-domain-containing protein [Lentithecium fluviatile CBS 122367]